MLHAAVPIDHSPGNVERKSLSSQRRQITLTTIATLLLTGPIRPQAPSACIVVGRLQLEPRLAIVVPIEESAQSLINRG